MVWNPLVFYRSIGLLYGSNEAYDWCNGGSSANNNQTLPFEKFQSLIQFYDYIYYYYKMTRNYDDDSTKFYFHCQSNKIHIDRICII